MALRARLVSLLLAAALVTACGAMPAPSGVVLAETSTPAAAGPQGSSNPCTVAVTYLGAFTQQLADDLASLRPLVVAKTFDSGATVVASRRVSATLTAYLGLERTLGSCAATAELGQRVERLRASATTTLNKALSASIVDAQTQRGAAVSLFGLLPEVLALSEAGKTVADSLEMAWQVAQVPDGAAQPIGKLAPLPTPTPIPTRTLKPRSSPKPTARPVSGGSSGGTAGYPRTVTLYLASVETTYNKMIGTGVWPGRCAVGDNPELCYAKNEGERLRQEAFAALGNHLRFIESHPRACLRDAYADDRRLAQAWTGILTFGFIGADTSSDRVQRQGDSFMSKLNSYISDCR